MGRERNNVLLLLYRIFPRFLVRSTNFSSPQCILSPHKIFHMPFLTKLNHSAMKIPFPELYSLFNTAVPPETFLMLSLSWTKFHSPACFLTQRFQVLYLLCIPIPLPWLVSSIFYVITLALTHLVFPLTLFKVTVTYLRLCKNSTLKFPLGKGNGGRKKHFQRGAARQAGCWSNVEQGGGRIGCPQGDPEGPGWPLDPL